MPRREEFLGCARAWGAVSAGPNIRSALLGKTPRYAPDRVFDTLHVALDLTVDFRAESIAGTCRTTVRPFHKTRRLEFDAVGLTVLGVKVDGRRARHAQKDGRLTVLLPRALDDGQRAQVDIRYKAVKPKAGLHFVKNPVQVWSQSQPEDARAWFPCHDAPHEKATSELRVTVPKGFVAVSNGALVERTQRARSVVWHWRMDQPHSIYLISLAAGRFAEVRDEWKGIPVTYYCEKGREEDARRGFAKTVKAIDFFSEKTGVPYPYAKYAQVAVAEYPGGMEHTTCTTQTDACLIDARASLDNDMDLLVAHELAHQWFGDLVTCRDWSHAWLNEGFATYFEVLFQEHDKGADEADYELYANARAYFEEDSRRYRRPIVSPLFKQPWTIFDRHLYEKGAWVLHMLRHELGDEAWWRGISHYLKRHQGKTVETADLIESLREATGRNLKPFFDQWVMRAGYPSFRVAYSWDPQKRQASLWVLQTQDISDENPAYKARVKIRAEGRGWTREFTERITAKEHVFEWTLPAEPLNVEFDCDHVLLKRATILKPHAMWRHQLRHGRAALSRVEAAWALARWGADADVALLFACARRDPFWGAAAEAARALGTVKTDASWRALKRLASHPHPKVRRAVMEALGDLGRAEAAMVLAPHARKDPSIHVEAEAARSLGRLRAAGPLLKAALKKTGYRDIPACGALAGLSSARAPGVLALLRRMSLPPASFYRRALALRLLADHAAQDSRVVPWLCEALGERDERLALSALAQLGRLQDPRAIPAIRRAQKSASTRVRVYADEALARILGGGEHKRGGQSFSSQRSTWNAENRRTDPGC